MIYSVQNHISTSINSAYANCYSIQHQISTNNKSVHNKPFNDYYYYYYYIKKIIGQIIH